MSLVDRLQQLWLSAGADSVPDLHQWLDGPFTGDTKELLEAIRWDQQQRWKTSQPLRAEEYLAKLRGLPAGVDWMFELAVGEFEARRDTNRPLSEAQISSRFPQLGSTLRERLAQRNVPSTRLSPDAIPDTKIVRPSELCSYITEQGIVVGEKGRYRLDRVLGEGAFGRVYLGYDEQLHRQVAIKVPNCERFHEGGDAEAYLAEARMVAALEHPSIVPVHTAERTGNGLIFIVSRFLDGGTLKDQMKGDPWDPTKAVELLIPIARGLHFAHQKRLIHRDVKPANILLESGTGPPFLADFGLAIREDDYLQQATGAGTPEYMSPEQARGEGHRLDGRSDLFSLGVIFYELLTGQRPFRGRTVKDIFREVISTDPKPPRQLQECVPSELERICLKALSKRASDRYANAAAFAEDLEEWLKRKAIPKAVTKVSATVVPKGLRSFDAEDASFFLDLLPGLRNRDGLPESIAFWKQRIEETDPEKTFNVGLLYGPSGCGKSSLVKAGLLPNLSSDVIAVYVVATPEETELRILRGLSKRLPELENPLKLAETLTAIRRGHSRKVVILIDQFEQWLHAHRSETDAELIQALRQCDGCHVQAIVMIRDDFAMAAARFMQALDVAIVQGHNFATVDLFEVDHARNVLIKFGQSFGKLPDNVDHLSADEKRFVSHVANGLAQDGKVVSVRLALFAEMIKSKRWTPEILQAVGGTEGIGVNFLDETFSSAQANPRHRLHVAAARAVLNSLLPELGTDIKGHMRSQQELMNASGYHGRPDEFSDLLRTLDSELRLITPTAPEGDAGSATVNSSPTALRYYQLTHDYLVPSLREWLTRKQRETCRGRAELTLEERAAIWGSKREHKQLPTVIEWLSIRTRTSAKSWTEPQRAMMRTAAAVHALSWGGLLVIVLIAALWIQHWITAERWKNLQEQTGTAVVALQNNLGPSVPFNLEKLRTLPEQLVMPDLQARFSSTTNPRHKLSLAFALAGFGKLDAAYLVSRIDDIAEADTRNYIRAMQANPGSALAALKTEALQCSDKSTWRRKAKLSISALALGDTELAQEMCVFESRPDPEQRTLFIDEFRHWDIDLMIVYDAVKRSDSPALRSGICLAVGQRPVESLQDIEKSSWQTLATQWFTENGDTSTHSAAGWLLRHWKAPIPLIRKPHDITPQRDWYVVKTSADTMLRIRPAPADASAIPNPIVKYTEQLRKLETAEAAELETPEFLETRAMACFYSGKLAEALNDFHRLTKTGSTERSPSILKYLTLTLARLGRADEARASLAGYLESDITASQRTCMQIQIGAWLGEIAEASRQLDSAIKEGPSDHDTLYRMATAAADCAQATAEPDPESSRSFRMRALDLLQTLSDLGYRQWDDLSQDADFAVLHGDERFTSIISTMKSPREFWVADREVTRGQFEAFMNDTDYDTAEKPVAWTGVDSESSPSADHPAQQVSWFDAVMYCNWLSHREGLQPCYERTGAKETGKHDEMTRDAWRVVPGSTGYRLLNESEWEYACRAGTTTEFSSGNDEGLLVAYCLMYPSKLTVCGEKLPNAWGVHDMHGNVWELCWDQYEESRVNHVLRRGAFIYNSSLARSAGHSNGSPANRNDDVGFRVARTPPFAPQTVPEARENLRN